ncbi:hypothetical protein K450DRAFT_235996 [Umbelopsis ramanniana AG]|uniref:Uncharacterized protein n=1 Tax=Umbelopsis ramanniana AG TaxID=1314678 RepID=A0AAD5ECC0_UMBRA|nr:uncharacterized protein K450DRAFT_235996 [Umbelopsis ramanniana AG]KAI8580792.1 hypothetical protein K450DRAFT_235996 [Umbelopsis ramanniana AG]
MGSAYASYGKLFASPTALRRSPVIQWTIRSMDGLVSYLPIELLAMWGKIVLIYLVKFAPPPLHRGLSFWNLDLLAWQGCLVRSHGRTEPIRINYQREMNPYDMGLRISLFSVNPFVYAMRRQSFDMLRSLE